MTQSLTKQEKLVLAGLLVCCIGVASFITNFDIIPKTAQVVEKLIDYKMGKANDEMISTYSLDGREIDRTVIKEEGFVAKAVRKISEIIGKKNDPKKEAAKKAADEKKAKAEAQAKAKKLPNRDFAKPVANAPAQKAAVAAKDDSEVQMQDLNNGAGYAAAPTEANNQQTPAAETKKVKKTLEQIRTEFMANPTREAMMALVNSYKKNEVTSANFYQLQSELLESDNQTIVGHALYGLRLTPSAESFSMMAQYQSQASTTYQTYIEEALLSYNQSSQISVLATVIRSGDKVVVMKALQVVTAGINSIQNGTVSQLVDSRGRRETTFSSFNVQNYLSLLPVITQVLASTQDSEVLALLTSTQTLINESNNSNVASN